VSGEEVREMTRDAKSIAIGVFLALVAFRLFEMVLRLVRGSMQLPVLLVILAIIALVVVATSRRGRLRR
jgi:hypothetical protein